MLYCLIALQTLKLHVTGFANYQVMQRKTLRKNAVNVTEVLHKGIGRFLLSKNNSFEMDASV